MCRRRISTLISSFILLRDTLALLPALAAALEPAQSQLLGVMRSTFQHRAFRDILDQVSEVIDEVSGAASWHLCTNAFAQNDVLLHAQSLTC